jgi:N-methylhydantoinase B
MTDQNSSIDSITLEIMRNQLESIAEEMGQVLITSAYSPNIKERQDCSTALFDADGRLVAQAEHIPVHLGAMPASVAAVTEHDPQPGDVFVLNDPFEGGTHLPDITMVSPLTHEPTNENENANELEIIGYAASRAHHADVGGSTPGSMPAGTREIYSEGLRLPPVQIKRDGVMNRNVIQILLANVRNPSERRADIRAQLAANERAETRISELVDDYDKKTVLDAFDAVIQYSHDRMTSAIDTLPDGEYTTEDALEGDSITEDDISIVATVTIDGTTVDVDFTGTAAQVAGNMNAPPAVARSAVYFVLRCVTDPEIPPNQGCYDPITVTIPDGSLLHPDPPAAVVGGNVETSQRVTDVVFTACADAVPERVPAQGQGTMNNLTIGNREGGFTYYETIGGGFGARPDRDGMDGVQVGMTNTLNTPVESLELEYPLRVERYALRSNSGGSGQYRGGLGIERQVTVETDATVSLLTDRRRSHPKGIDNGQDGATGKNLLDGDSVPAKTTRDVSAGTTVTVVTPGGGGYGDPEDRDEKAIACDMMDEKVNEQR